MKLVVNTCYGGFGLSRTAFLRLRELGHRGALEESDIGELWDKNDPESGIREGHYDSFFSRSIDRSDPLLVRVVEELGDVASSRFAELEIVEIPDGVEYEICDYDGIETVHEKHKSW